MATAESTISRLKLNGVEYIRGKIPNKGQPKQGTVVLIDVEKLDAVWARNGPADYIPPHTTDTEHQLRNRKIVRDGLQGDAPSLFMPELRPYTEGGAFGSHIVDFADGRHHFAVLRDLGWPVIPVIYKDADAPYLRDLFVKDYGATPANIPDGFKVDPVTHALLLKQAASKVHDEVRLRGMAADFRRDRSLPETSDLEGASLIIKLCEAAGIPLDGNFQIQAETSHDSVAQQLSREASDILAQCVAKREPTIQRTPAAPVSAFLPEEPTATPDKPTLDKTTGEDNPSPSPSTGISRLAARLPFKGRGGKNQR